jgi:uncharacterized protein YndB with AHSA1/START domain
MDDIIHVEAKLRCAPAHAFKMFTENRSLERWLTSHAEIEPKVGGKFELFWNPKDRENDSTIGCKVLACNEGQLIAFEWKGPKEFKELNLERPLTTVVVSFFPALDGTTVHLIHSGWRSTPQWRTAFDYFVRNWRTAFTELERVVNESRTEVPPGRTTR